MIDNITVNLDEAKRVYDLIETFHDFFHQPANYENVDQFAQAHYDELRAIYYDVIWHWLPESLQKEIEER